MKHCGLCGAELPTSLHEFGGFDEPVCCQLCWLGLQDDREERLRELNEKIASAETELHHMQFAFSECQDDEDAIEAVMLEDMMFLQAYVEQLYQQKAEIR